MRLSERAVEFPRLVILAAILASTIGLAAVFTLPKERTPRIKLPVIIAAVPNPGADPTVNEREIIRRIADQVGTISGLKDRGSFIAHAMHGVAVMQFIFDDGVEVREAKRDIESLFNRIKGEFPREAQQDPGPIINDIAFENWPIIQIVVAGGDGGHERRRVAERLQTLVENVSGVSGVDIFGGLEREVQVEINPHRMSLYGFTYNHVAEAIQRANSETPSGAIKSSDGSEVRVRTESKLADIEAIKQVPLGLRDNKLVLVQDVSDVKMGHVPLTSMARYDGKDAAVLLVRAKTDIDVLATAQKIQAIVDKFVDDGQGEGTQIGTVRSQAREITYMLSQLGWSAVYGTVLVFAVLLIAMGWRNATLICIAVPFAIFVTGAIMWFAKHTIAPEMAINNMTLFAMILVTGMVVDGCIIVGENIFRHRELGRAPVDAAKRGIGEVGASLLSAYLTTFAAFAPMFLVRGVMGDFLELLPVVVLFALCSAMLVDHFILPVLSVYFMKPKLQSLSARREQAEADRTLTAEQAEIRSAQISANATMPRRIYGHMLGYAMHHRLMVLTVSVIAAFTPIAMFKIGAIDFEFFPESDIPIIEVYFELPLGASMEKRTAQVAEEIEKTVLAAVKPDEWYQPSPDSDRVRPVTTMGEPGALNIRLDAEGGSGPEFGMVYVELELAEKRDRTAAEIRKAIEDKLPPLPGVIVSVRSPKEGPPTGAPVLIRVLAQNETTLEQLSERAAVIEQLLRRVPEVYDVTSDFRLRPQYRTKPDYAVARLYDLEASQIDQSVFFALEGVKVGEVDFGSNDKIDIRVQNMLEYRDDFQDLMDLPLLSSTGRIVNLAQVTLVDRVNSANVIRQYDGKRVIHVRAQLRDGALADQVKTRLVAALRPELDARQQNRIVLGEDVIKADDVTVIEFGGENELRDEALADLNLAMGIAFAAMLIVLTFQFNSFVQPFIVLFSVPLSLIGVTIGLAVCGMNFSISAMIGVVALSGIVVNDAIVLVDFINRLRAAGLPLEKALVYGGALRLRPIFLTTATTVGGLLPLALNLAGGGEFWQPLSVTIMCGLAFATLLQLFIVPLSIYTFDRSHGASLLDPARRPEFANLQRIPPAAVVAKPQ